MSVQINVAANQAALTASIQAGVQAYNQRFAQNNQLNLTINPRAFSQPLGRITGDVKDFEAALAASNARVIAFGASTAVLGGVIRSFKELANVTIEVEKNLADINRVFGLTTSQLQKFSTDLFNVTKQTASSFNDASQAALEFSRQGLKAEETLQRTKDALTLTRLAGISTANAVDALTSTVNGFSATGVTTTQVLNKLVAVEQDFAVGAGDLAEALSRTGQAAQEAGVSLDQLNALVTSAQQSTARGGAVIGNALKTIFTRLQRTDTLDQLEAFNISVRDVQGNILPAVTILQNFAGAYQNLADAQRAQLSEQVAGVYQVNILKAIVNDLNKSQGVYAGALQRGAMATNEAEVATAKLNQTLDALLKQTATSTQQLANNIGKVTFEPLARYGTEQLKSLVESMNEILEGEGIGSTFANGLLKGIRNILAGPGAIAAFFTLFKLIQNSFTYLTQALPQIAGITTETQNRKNIESAILQIMSQQGVVAQALDGLTGNQAAQAQLLLQTARAQTAEYQKQAALAQQLAVQLSGQGVKVAGSRGLQVTRAGGYIPASTKMAEVVGAQAGGYSPGRVVPSPVGGVMNTAEDVKYIPGFAQPFINPPARSKAGRAHRQNAINRTGVDPYMANGFIPNFARTKKTDYILGSGFKGDLRSLPLNKNEEKEVGSVANLRTMIGSDFITDQIGGKKGIYYKIKEVKGETNEQMRKQAEDIAMKGLKEDIQKYIPTGKLADFDFDLWFNNRTLPNLTDSTQVERLTKNTGKGLVSFADQKRGLITLLTGEIFEQRVAELEKLTRSKISNDRFDFLPSDAAKFLGGEAKAGEFNLGNLVAKAIGVTPPGNFKNEKQDTIRLNSPIELYVPEGHPELKKSFNNGFIPNFATPMTTASIPWFKKYSSKYKNAAGDTDLFKMGDFPTYGRGLDHEYAKKGNSAMLSYLHEDFVRSALNIALGSKKVIRPAEVGFKDKPVSDIANENDFDLLYRIADGSYSMLELKQDFKNISGSVTGFMNKKLANLEKENPVLAKKVSSMIAVSNRPKFTDPTGRNAGANFSEFEMAAASIVKDKYSNVDPSISTKLTKITDGLLRRYEAKKNTTYDGFIPNFASMISSSIKGKGNISAIKTGKNNYEIEGVEVGKKFRGQGLGSQLYGSIAQKIGSGSTIKSVLLPQEQALADYASGKNVPAKAIFPQLSWAKMAKSSKLLVNGKEIAISDFESGIASHKYNASKLDMALIELINSHASGFIPNFNFIKGRNSFQKNWLIETAKKRNLNLNDPNTFTKLATEFAKTYPNDQGMFGLNKGFIPNFAYKQAVMGLEESMSGNKAIFDTKPFPHIRNSSQPTFSSAISDHGGLSNALSDSMRGQKAAGLMSKGFIPNFSNSRSARRRMQRNQSQNQSQNTQSGFDPNQLQADAERVAQDVIKKLSYAYNFVDGFVQTFITEVEDLSKSAKNNLSPAISKAKSSIGSLSNNISSSVSGLSKKINPSTFNNIGLLGPMIAGQLESFFIGDKKRTEMTQNERMLQSGLSTGFTAITTGADIGNRIFPGLGGAVGAAVGSLVGLVSAIDASKLSVEELSQMQQDKINKDKETLQSASSYVDNQKKLNDLIASGASDKDIKEASQKLTNSFNDIKNIKLAEIFAKTGGSVEKMSEELNKFTEQVNRRQNANTALSNLQQGSGTLGQYFGFSDTTAKKGVKKPTEVAAQLFATSKSFANSDTTDLMKTAIFEKTNEKIKKSIEIVKEIYPDVEQTSEEFENLRKAFSDLLFGASGFNIAQGLEKFKINDAVVVEISNFKKVATKSFAEIFRKIERDLNKNLFDIALSFEKDSSTRRIQSSILDFSINFQDSINSFISSNLPDIRKFDFAAVTAGQKAQMLLQKSQQDYDKAIADQQNERSNFLIKNTKDLSESFKSAISNSQVNAEFFKNKVLPQIQSGNYSGDVTGIIKGLKQAQITKVTEARSSADVALGATGLGFGSTEEIKQTLDSLSQLLKNPGLEEDKKSKIIAYQQELINLQETSLKYSNQAEKDKLSDMMREKAETQILFDIKQTNAKKELEINKQLNEANIKANKMMAVERAAVDKENFMRMESMKNMSATIANNLEVSKAEGTRDINRLKRTLQDPTGVAGLGVSERSERQFKIQEKILNKERAIEDANINAEIQQRMLELAAERENTTALYNLSQVIERFAAETLLKDLGGEQAFKEMQNNPYLGKNIAFERANLGADALPEQREFLDQAEKYTPEKLAKFEAYQRTKASIDASRSGNTSTATVDAFADRMSNANFNKMNRDQQMKFLAEERKKADEAGAVALSNTISRFQEQIKLRKEALDISRQDVNEQVELDKRIIRTNNSFAGRFKTSFNNLKYQGEEIFLKLGEDLPRMFADGLVNGIKAAIRESDNLGEALMGIAGNFLDAISTAMMQSAVYSMLGSMGFNMAGAAGSVPAAKQKGGFIRAQSGMYISGTGSGDKYPALLENGEYVLNRNAVMAMGGPAELDKLNFSMAPRFASGGSFATELNDIKSMEEGMTTFGLENSKAYNELRDAERAKQAEKRRKAAERRKMIAGLVGSVVGMAASFGIMKAAGSFGSSLKKDFGDVTMNVTPQQLTQNANLAQKGGHIGTRLSDTIPAYAEGGLYSSPIVKKYGVGMQNGGMYGGSSNNSNTVTNTNATNSFNFNTTVNRDGTIQMGADSTSYKQQDVELSNNLNSQVYKTVLDVIKQQQRFGGTLAGTRRPI